jgi:hypothetical protein
MTCANTLKRLHSSIWLFCNIVKRYVRHAELVSASLRVHQINRSYDRNGKRSEPRKALYILTSTTNTEIAKVSQ